MNTNLTINDFAAKAKKVADASRPRLFFCLDATASRRSTWEAAQKLQAEMLAMTTTLGSLELQIGVFGGNDVQISPWSNDAAYLAGLMQAVECRAGQTQIGALLDHAIAEAGVGSGRYKAFVFIGDSQEESAAALLARAKVLGDLGVPVIMVHEGRDSSAAQDFENMAEAGKGAFLHFDNDAIGQLRELLLAVTVFATQGIEGLKRSALPAAKLLLQHLPHKD